MTNFSQIFQDSTWSLYWQVPEGVEIINLGQIIGDGLSDSGDQLVLKDENNTIIDQISYGTDTAILNPSISDVAEGHSIERSPTGSDTDSASDFIDKSIPTPGS